MKLFFSVFLIAQVFYVSAYCEVQLSLNFFSGYGINISHEFKKFEGILDLDATVKRFNFRPNFDSTTSQRKLYSYYTHDESSIMSLSAGLGYIRKESRLKTGPMLFFRYDIYTEPHLLHGEYNNLVSYTICLCLGFVNYIYF